MPSFKGELDSGYVSARIPANAYMDAAVAGDIAGAEFAVERVHFNTESGNFRANPCITLDMDPATMRALGLLLLAKSGAPAFNEREWRVIAVALRAYVYSVDYVYLAEGERAAEDYLALAQRIEQAYP